MAKKSKIAAAASDLGAAVSGLFTGTPAKKKAKKKTTTEEGDMGFGLFD